MPGLGILPLTTPEERRSAYAQIVPYTERLEQHAAAERVERLVEDCGSGRTPNWYMLNWNELTDLAARGVGIGPHTQHHIVLAQATPEQVRAEVEGSWADLQARLRQPLPIFCYPNGMPHAVNGTAAAAVRQAGLAGAYTMVSGHNVIGQTNPYYLHRMGMEAGESFRKFTMKLTPTGAGLPPLEAPAQPHRRRRDALLDEVVEM